MSAQLEVAADEGGAGDAPEAVPLPDLSHFGIVAAESAAALAMDFQVAQKMHACTDPHSEERRNDRVHDVVDLLLVREAFFSDEDLLQLRQACEAIFDARARDAHSIDHPVRDWLPQLEAHSHWASTYPALAGEVGLTLTFDEAVAASTTGSARSLHREPTGDRSTRRSLGTISATYIMTTSSKTMSKMTNRK